MSFTHRHVVPNQIECLFSLKTKWLRLRLPHLKGKRCKSLINVVRNAFTWENKETKYTTFMTLLNFFYRRTKVLQVWSDMRVKKWWPNHFHSSVSLLSKQTLQCFVSSIVSSSFRVCWQRLDFCVHGCSVAVNRPVVNVNRWWRLHFCLLVWKWRT